MYFKLLAGLIVNLKNHTDGSQNKITVSPVQLGVEYHLNTPFIVLDISLNKNKNLQELLTAMGVFFSIINKTC